MGLDRVDFVKCDVEGAEVKVLQGAKLLLSGSEPPIWMLEFMEPFLKQAGHDPSSLLKTLTMCCPNGKLFTQDKQGTPREIFDPSQRILGNNIFYVPLGRLSQFQQAAALMAPQ
jgi:hypothetical protein